MILFFIYIVAALLISIAVEVLIAFVFGYRKKLEILAIILVNLITNPLLNYIITIRLRNIRYNPMYDPSGQYTILISELIVIIVEWLLLRFALRNKSIKLMMLSITMNIVSYVVGLIITYSLIDVFK